MSSGVLAGKFQKEEIYTVEDSFGVTFKEALESIDYSGSMKNRLKKATAFLELHIEQGPILDHCLTSIGIVDCVVGMTCYNIKILGESNHAGTTPMSMRNDALFNANDLITLLRERLGKIDKQLVFTKGKMDVYPNLHTIIPERVSFTVEARHQDAHVILEVEEVIKGLARSHGEESSAVNVKKMWERETIWFESRFRDLIEKSASELKFSYQRLVSGAGHDAQFIADYIPSAMIFVPSVNGKSHAEDEMTHMDDCEKGINVLLKTVMQLMKEN